MKEKRVHLIFTQQQVEHIIYAVRTNAQGNDDDTREEARDVIETIRKQIGVQYEY